MSHSLYSAATPAVPPLAAPPTAARRRARRVDEVAARPDLQRELALLVGRVQGLLAGRAVLEVACGAGWWTRHLALAAQGVLALDDDADLLRAAAAAGKFPPGRVRFTACELGGLERVSGAWDAGFSAFLPSALPEDDAAAVLAGLHRRLGPGARVVLIDERDAFGGTDEAALRRRLRDLPPPDAQGVKLDLGAHFWCLGYTL